MGRRLGDRLAALSTHNEPWCTAVMGHATGQFAPGLRDPDAAVVAGHHVLLSHGLAMQAMRAAGVACPLGIVLNQSSASAATASAADCQLSEQQYASMVRWFIDPVLLGRYPEVPGVAVPQAPLVHEGDLALIRAPLDFLGVNYYTRLWASVDQTPAPCELGVTDMGWEIFPDGLRELLTGLHATYPLPPIYITENGCACADVLDGGRVHDEARIDYLRRHLTALAEARAAGVDIRGYFAWSLMDNFEWDSGYAKRFGLVHVDYATQVRTPKDSALWYRDLIAASRRGATGA
jgi:beta-glucosidase